MELRTGGTMSRRGFLAGSALAAGSAALATGGGLAYADAEPTEVTGGAGTGGFACETYDADVVVIGSGLCGLTAAMEAQAQGVDVIIVDKGPFGYSGAAGYNWGIISAYLNDNANLDMLKRYCSAYMGGMGNQSNINAAIDEWNELRADLHYVNQARPEGRSFRSISRTRPNEFSFLRLGASGPGKPAGQPFFDHAGMIAGTHLVTRECHSTPIPDRKRPFRRARAGEMSQ